MKLKSGELYFIGERDVLSGATSGYFKIGLVKDSRSGGADNRLDEHQTGNPRRLEIVESVSTPAIEDLETTMHDRFALDRVRGEWFELSPARLADAVTAATALAAEQLAHADAARRAVELGKELSTGETRAATDDDLEFHRRVLETKVVKDRIGALVKRSDALFKAAIAEGRDVGRFMRSSERAGTKFDKEKFTESHPDLFARYTKIETRFSHLFRPATSKAALDAIEPDDGFLDLERRIESVIEQATTDPALLERLHLLRLELLGFDARTRWEDDFARTNLMVACGQHSGIDGVVPWNREMKESERFDEAAFKTDHPDLHAQFVVTTLTQVFNFEMARGYVPSTPV